MGVSCDCVGFFFFPRPLSRVFGFVFVFGGSHLNSPTMEGTVFMCEGVVVFPAPNECKRDLALFQALSECQMGVVGDGLRQAFRAARAACGSGSDSESGSDSDSHGSMDADDEEVAAEEKAAEEEAREEDRLGHNIEEDYGAPVQCVAPCWMAHLMFMSDTMVVAGACVEDSHRLFVPQAHLDCVPRPVNVSTSRRGYSDSDSDSGGEEGKK